MIVQVVKVGFAVEKGFDLLVDCTVSLIEAGEFRILFDTGGSWEANSLNNVGNLTHVICSHGHSDHVGCLSLFP